MCRTNQVPDAVETEGKAIGEMHTMSLVEMQKMVSVSILNQKMVQRQPRWTALFLTSRMSTTS